VQNRATSPNVFSMPWTHYMNVR